MISKIVAYVKENKKILFTGWRENAVPLYHVSRSVLHDAFIPVYQRDLRAQGITGSFHFEFTNT